MNIKNIGNEYPEILTLKMCAAVWGVIERDPGEFEMIWSLDEETATLIDVQRRGHRNQSATGTIIRWIQRNRLVLPADTMKAFVNSKQFASQSFLYHLNFPKNIACKSIARDAWRPQLACAEDWQKLRNALIAQAIEDNLRSPESVEAIERAIGWLERGKPCEAGCIWSKKQALDMSSI
jgi:hypothetical protein